MEELAFKILKIIGPHEELVVRSSNFRAAIEKALLCGRMSIWRCGRGHGSF
jgi:hypothetical protein